MILKKHKCKGVYHCIYLNIRPDCVASTESVFVHKKLIQLYI